MPTTSIQCDYLPKASLSSIQIDFKHEYRWTRDEAYDRLVSLAHMTDWSHSLKALCVRFGHHTHYKRPQYLREISAAIIPPTARTHSHSQRLRALHVHVHHTPRSSPQCILVQYARAKNTHKCCPITPNLQRSTPSRAAQAAGAGTGRTFAIRANAQSGRTVPGRRSYAGEG